MTPLEQELYNLKCRCTQQIRMDKDEIQQAERLIQQCKQRIEYNQQLLEELTHEEVHKRREIPTSCACAEGEERCTYCY